MADDPMIAYCGVTCAACPDYAGGKCPGCRKTVWGRRSLYAGPLL